MTVCLHTLVVVVEVDDERFTTIKFLRPFRSNIRRLSKNFRSKGKSGGERVVMKCNEVLTPCLLAH